MEQCGFRAEHRAEHARVQGELEPGDAAGSGGAPLASNAD
jgi:hypothetical protein